MDYMNFIERSKKAVVQYVNGTIVDSDILIREEDVYVVWYCKTLQNVKALLSTDLPDGMYYESTYNGIKNEIYFDAYKKVENIKIELS